MPQTKTVTVTELRKNLARLVATVRYGSDFVVISRKDEDNVYLISQADWDLLDRKIDEFDIGRWSKRRGRMVGGLMSLLWRERTLESEDDAPRTGADFERVEEDVLEQEAQEEAEEKVRRDRFNAVVNGSIARMRE